MAAREIPTIMPMARNSSSYSLGADNMGMSSVNVGGLSGFIPNDHHQHRLLKEAQFVEQRFDQQKAEAFFEKLKKEADAAKQQPSKGKELTVSRRVVQVIIADPNENIPLDQCILFQGEQKLTDLNDQELFFELDINTMLKNHNVKRVTFRDKKVKDRVELLEPAKVRDLKMVVVTVATL